MTRKPPELPDVIRQIFVDEVQTPPELIGRVYARLKEITDTNGMGCRIEPEHSTDGKKQKSIFVPIHMITYLEAEIKAVTGDMPEQNPEAPGEFMDRQGKKVGLQ